MEITLTFSKDGIARCLWTDALPLTELGRLAIRRASTIEFAASTQQWEVRLAAKPNVIVFSDASRRACVEWEQQHLQAGEHGQ